MISAYKWKGERGICGYVMQVFFMRGSYLERENFTLHELRVSERRVGGVGAFLWT